MVVPLTPLEFRRRAIHLYPQKIGVVDGSKRFTYSEFGDRVNRLAMGLHSHGYSGKQMSFHLSQIIPITCWKLTMGSFKLGAILNPINVRLAGEEIGFILNHSESQIVFYHSDFRLLIQKLQPRLNTVKYFVEIDTNSTLPGNCQEYEALLAAAGENTFLNRSTDENAPAELFYTSGTTGRPKGVVLSHRALYLHALGILDLSAFLRP